MKLVGNVASNRLFNPRNVKPSIPIDIDEVDGVMERFIRQKYELKTLSESQPATTQHTGSTSSDDRTPQLPPKPNKRFTFSLRSTSSTLPLPRKELSPPVSPGLEGFGLGRRGSRESPQRRTKPSRIFGTDIGGSRADNYELKLINLREMGFPDDKRNLTILKGENGNVDRAVATLIRLGEGSRASSGRSSPVPETPPKDDDYIPGIIVEKNATMGAKMNPFDKLDLTEKALPPPPVEEQNSVQDGVTHNPFLQPSQGNLEQSFQGLQISQPSHLFPNATGGYMQHNQPVTTNPFLQTYTPPPQMTYSGSFNAPVPFAPPQIPFEQLQRTASPNNPFLRNSPSQPFSGANPYASSLTQPQSLMSNDQFNPFSNNQTATPQYPTQPTQPTGFISGAGSQPSFQPDPPRQLSPSNPFHAATFPLPSQPFQTQGTPFFTSGNYMESPVSSQPSQSIFQNNPFNAGYMAPAATQSPQATRYDKASILALYNLAPTNNNAEIPNNGISANPSSGETAAPYSSLQPNMQEFPAQHPATAGAKRSVTMPLPMTNSHNVSGAIPSSSAISNDMPSALPQSQQFQQLKSAQGPFGPRPGHESVDFAAAAGLLSGRHSPELFAGLSARLR
jgi:hypothetical protein